MPHMVMLYTPQLDAACDIDQLSRGLSDGSGDHAFMYFNLRMARGRSAAVHRAVGEALAAVVREQMAPVLAQHPVGLTLQVDEGPEVFDAKLGNLHPLFAKK